MHEFVLRPTVIGEQRYRNDYAVIWKSPAWGDRHVGRIRLATEQSYQGTVWTFHLQPAIPVRTGDGNGRADSLEQAKAKFRAAFERFCADAGDLNRAFPAKRG